MGAEDPVQAFAPGLGRGAVPSIVPYPYQPLGQHVQAPPPQELFHVQRDDMPPPAPALLAVQPQVALPVIAE